MSEEKQEEKQDREIVSGFEILKTILVSLMICVTIIVVASIMCDQEPKTEIVYEQLPVCSLNPLVVGQTYEVDGKILILGNTSNYGDGGLRLYFEVLE